MRISYNMKVVICILLALLGFIQANAMHVKVVGEIENHKFIDRQAVYFPAHLNEKVSKAFAFPPVSQKSLQTNISFVFSLFNSKRLKNKLIHCRMDQYNQTT